MTPYHCVARDGYLCGTIIVVQACGAAILLAIVLAPQLFFNRCADTCAASIMASFSASVIQTRLGKAGFQSTVIKVYKNIDEVGS